MYVFHVAYNKFLQHDYYGTIKGDVPHFKVSYHSFSAYENVTYTDTVTGKIYSGNQLKNGIEITASSEDEYSVIMLFEKM